MSTLVQKRRKEEEEKKKKEFQEMLEKQLELHVKSRTTRYPNRSAPSELIYRFEVPDEKVPWEVILVVKLFLDVEIYEKHVCTLIHLHYGIVL